RCSMPVGAPVSRLAIPTLPPSSGQNPAATLPSLSGRLLASALGPRKYCRKMLVASVSSAMRFALATTPKEYGTAIPKAAVGDKPMVPHPSEDDSRPGTADTEFHGH